MRKIGGELLAVCFLTYFLISIGTMAHAAPVTGPWTNATGQGDGPITQADTNMPIVGDGSMNSADGEMFDSPFPEITLANAGDKIVFTGSVTLTGTINSPLTSGTPRTQFRFGLFDGDEDGPDDNGWVGYYMSNRHGNPGNPRGTLALKPVGNTSAYLSVTGQTSLTTVEGDGTAASLFNDDTYTMNLTVERNAAAELVVSGTLTGALGFTQTLTATNTTASTLGTYTFDHLGFLLAGNLDTDQAAFMDLDVTFMPASTVLLGDYNRNNEVDAADYVVWRDTLNQGVPEGEGADGNRNGMIDQEDYEIWMANFGKSDAPGVGAGTTVPEPATSGLFAIAALIMAGGAVRRLTRN